MVAWLWLLWLINEKISDFEVGIKPMTTAMPVGCYDHWATRTLHGFVSYLKLWNLYSSSFNFLLSNHHLHHTSMEEFNAIPSVMYLNYWSLGHVKPSQWAKLAVGWNRFQWLNLGWMQMRCIFPSWNKILSLTPQDLTCYWCKHVNPCSGLETFFHFGD